MKDKNKIAKCIHSAQMLQMLAKLNLWRPSPQEELAFSSQLTLRNTLKDMVNSLKK